MQTLTLIQTISVWIIPVLLAITLHEAAHAWVASLCGDSSARALGRLSANPLKHIDPMGTVFVPILVGVLSGFQFVFGWAKPVPIDSRQLRNPRRDMALVALAGPVSNFIMALFWGICAKIGSFWTPESSPIALFLLLTGEAGLFINLVLGFLNLIPVPPLDGGRIVAGLLPPKWAYYYARIEPFGFFIIIALLFTGVLGQLVATPLVWSIDAINTLLHIA